MALIGLVNLTERLLNQTAGQNDNAQTGTTPASGAQDRDRTTTAADQFTPSAPNASGATAEAAGLFTVSQFTLFSAAADFLLAQTLQPAAPPAANAQTTGNNANPLALALVPTATTALAPTAAAGNAAAASQAATTVPAPNTNTGIGTGAAAAGANATAAQAPAANTAAAANATGSAVATAAGSPNVQSQLQSLNNALAALGLSQADIQVIDRIASVIQDFSATAFTSLVYQLEALAQNAAQTSATPAASTNPLPNANGAAATATNANSANTAANAAAGTSPAGAAATTPAIAAAVPTNAPNTTGASPNGGGGLQVQELVIRFSGAEVQGTLGGATNGTANNQNANGGTTFQASAFNLQVQEIALTLNNANGQTIQVRAPRDERAANATGGTATTALARAAGA